jgi:GTP:adenosylcobinamide-phosphate guanylyltransferase
MKNVAIIQARMSSSRLPGKVLLPLSGIPVLEHVTKRVMMSRMLNKVIIATSIDDSDNAIEEWCKKNNIEFYRGSLDDVLDRFYKAACFYDAENILRITADCPVIDFEIIDEGTGIDVNSLECLLNSVRMDKDYLNIEVVSQYHVIVDYTPEKDLFFSKDYKVSVKVQDTSPQTNRMNSSYTFYTADSTGVLIVDPSPGICKGGMQRFQDVSVKVLADGNGVDVGSIRMQIFNKDVHPRILPIIYRIS